MFSDKLFPELLSFLAVKNSIGVSENFEMNSKEQTPQLHSPAGVCCKVSRLLQVWPGLCLTKADRGTLNPGSPQHPPENPTAI